MPSGKVKWFDTEKGFGFLSQSEGPDVYVHADALPEGGPPLAPPVSADMWQQAYGLWEYLFFIDLEGHQSDATMQQALMELRERAAFVKVLGSYPVAVL